jgi:hypothetical protein
LAAASPALYPSAVADARPLVTISSILSIILPDSGVRLRQQCIFIARPELANAPFNRECLIALIAPVSDSGENGILLLCLKPKILLPRANLSARTYQRRHGVCDSSAFTIQ